MSLKSFALMLLQAPAVLLWTDYQTVNIQAYTRMKGNGSVDQAVVVLVNDATFAYFDKAKKTFVLRPSATTGFSVLDDSDQSFCMYEVLRGFHRQEEYLSKLREQTGAARPPLDVSQPQLVVSSTVRGSVQLDCKTLYTGVSQCYFYPERDYKNLKLSPSCQLSLTGSELVRWTGHSYRSPQSVNIICYYTVDEFRNQAESPHSLPAPVTVLDAPQLSVSTSGRSSVQLNCTPPYAGVSQCYFYPEGHERDLKFPSCQLSLNGAELTTWAGRSNSSLKPVNVICYYSVKISGRQRQSPHSLPAPVRILDKKPTMTVSHDDQCHEFTLVCEISLSLSADVGCDFYIGDEQLKWMISQRTRSGSLACSFTAHKDYLLSRMKSAKSRELSCDYSLNSDQTVHSPLSDPYSLTQLPPLPTPKTTTQPIKPKSKTEVSYTVATLPSETTTDALTTHSKQDDHIQKLSRRTFLILLLSTTSVSVLLAGVMMVCLCRFIRKQKTERSFKVNSKGGNQGDMITMVSVEDDSIPMFNYSMIESVPTPSQPSVTSSGEITLQI